MADGRLHNAEGALVSAGLMLVAAVVSAVVACCLMLQVDDRRALAVEIGPQGGSAASVATAASAAAAREAAQASPGTLVRDGEGVVWTSATAEGEVFHLRYDGADGKAVTVETGDGDKVVAPGTENTFRFSAENKMDEAVEYKVEASVDVKPQGAEVPLEGRVSSASGYLAGDGDTWVPLTELGVLEDGAKLGARQTADYSLEWRWPFERGEGDGLASNDSADTALGNRGADEDVEVDVNLRVTASYDGGGGSDAGSGDGAGSGSGAGARPGAWGLPKTGDLVQFGLFALSALLALGAVAILLVKRPRRERDDDGE